MFIGSSSSTDTAPAPPLLTVAWQNMSRRALQHVPRRRITHTVLKEKHQVAFCLAHLLLVRAGQTSPPRRQNTRCHCCMREHESVTAACANMSVTASATKYSMR
jgi:hypothetical protein